MKLKITQPKMAGYTTMVEINGEIAADVLTLDLHIDPTTYSTVTMTRILEELNYDGEVEDDPAEANPYDITWIL